jgi:hypothetical protein
VAGLVGSTGTGNGVGGTMTGVPSGFMNHARNRSKRSSWLRGRMRVP